ncbi:MAG: carbohydrate ABC transporter permease [Bacilli bacterium]
MNLSLTNKKSKKEKRKYHKEEVRSALILLLPSFIILTIFVIFPLLFSIKNSFYDSNKYMAPKYVGLQNYITILADKAFLKSLFVGLKFVALIVPAQIILAFIIAHFVLKLKGRIARIAKVAIYMPCLLSGIVVGAIFSYIYAYDGGLLNWILSWFSIEKVAWVNDPKWAIIAVSLAAIWNGLGYVTLVMMGGLLDIPKDYYEAAKIDGANGFQRMIYITIPCLKNIGIYLLVSCFVASFQIFELPFIITGGGPLDSTLGPVGFLYYHFTWDNTLGYTYAASVLITIVITSLSAIVFKLISSEKSGE